MTVAVWRPIWRGPSWAPPIHTSHTPTPAWDCQRCPGTEWPCRPAQEDILATYASTPVSGCLFLTWVATQAQRPADLSWYRRGLLRVGAYCANRGRWR